MKHSELKTRHRAERAGHPRDHVLRVHRALSWLDRAEQSATDEDARFIFLWISFNAAYARELGSDASQTERERLHAFLGQLVRVDAENQIGALLWREFSGIVRLLLDNEYVFQPYWDWRNGRISETEYQRQFDASRRAVATALKNNDTNTLLQVVCHRLYTLRNQLVHGGATWNSDVNRDQLRDSTNLLARLVPLIIEIIMNNPDADWGPVHYPVAH